MQTRRAFLGRCGAGAAVWTALAGGDWSPFSALAAEFDVGQLGELAAFAIERAKAAGASYADIRINRYRSQFVGFRVQADRATGKPVEVPSVSDSGSFGFGLRVLADGAWGFSASHDVTRESLARAAGEAVEIARANAPLRLAADQARGHTSLQRYVPHQDRHRSLLGSSRAKARASAHRRRRCPQGPRCLLRDRHHGRSPRRSILRLFRGKCDRAARLPDLSRRHGNRRRSRPQGQIAHLPAARRLRRLRGRRARGHAQPGAPRR